MLSAHALHREEMKDKAEGEEVGVRPSQKGLNVDIQGRAGHRQLKLVDDIRVKHSQPSYALTVGKDLSAAAWEKGGVLRSLNVVSLFSARFHIQQLHGPVQQAVDDLEPRAFVVVDCTEPPVVPRTHISCFVL